MKSIKSPFLAAMVAACLIPASAQALMLSFDFGVGQNFGSDSLRALATVNDETAGFLTFNIEIAPNGTLPNTGDLFGVFLEFNPHPASGIFAGPDITGVATNTLNAGGGNNLNGTISGLVPGGTFDFALTLGSSGASGGLLTSTSFTMSTNGGAVKLSDLIAIGLRAQSVGGGPNGGGGSAKLYSANGTTPPTPNPNNTPVPDGGATIALLGLSLLGLTGIRRALRNPAAS
jgi:hypothetical protein